MSKALPLTAKFLLQKNLIARETLANDSAGGTIPAHAFNGGLTKTIIGDRFSPNVSASAARATSKQGTVGALLKLLLNDLN